MTLDDPDLVPLEQAERARARPEDVPLLVLTAAELLTLPLRPRGMVLDPVIPERGLAMLYSKRGVGKTFTALAAAHAVASGGAFLPWTAPLPRPVLYVDGEMPAATMRERLDAIMQGATGPAMPDLSFLRIISPEMQVTGLPDLSGRAGKAKVEAALGDAVRDLEDAAQANAAALFGAGLSIREVAEELGISKSKAHRIKQGMAAGPAP